jgi:hypothetical protein
MKSIKQQYIDLCEGRMSQANFMRNLRMTMPQYITNVTSFKDSVKILKNKGILNEVIKPSELAMGIKIEMEHTDDMAVAKKIAMDHLAENPNYYSELKSSGIDTAQGLKSTIDNGDANLNKANPRDGFSLGFFEESEDKSLNEAKDEKGRWTNANGKSMYDQFKEIDNLNGQEVLIGIDWEMQCNPDLSKRDIVKKVIKNLKKNPIYYTAWDMSGVEGYEPEYMSKSSNPEDWQMQPLDKNMGNVVDKKMGMQPVKDVEKPKKDSDKGGETNKTVKGVELMSLIAKTVRGMQKMDATGEKMKKISVKEGMESMDKMEVGDKVKIDPEVFPNINKPSKQVYSLPGKVNMKLDSKETYTIKKITGRDAALEDSKGNEAGYVNMSNLIKSIDENKVAKLRERLKDMIRKEIKEAAGAYGYGDAMSVKDINEVDIYGIAGNPEEEMAARMARRPMDKYEPLSITKADRDRDLDDMLADAEYNIDSVVSQVGNDVKLGTALISRAREIKPSLVPGLRQALNLYNK